MNMEKEGPTHDNIDLKKKGSGARGTSRVQMKEGPTHDNIDLKKKWGPVPLAPVLKPDISNINQNLFVSESQSLYVSSDITKSISKPSVKFIYLQVNLYIYKSNLFIYKSIHSLHGCQ